jgi:hypothetical protein
MFGSEKPPGWSEPLISSEKPLRGSEPLGRSEKPRKRSEPHPMNENHTFQANRLKYQKGGESKAKKSEWETKR